MEQKEPSMEDILSSIRQILSVETKSDALAQAPVASPFTPEESVSSAVSEVSDIAEPVGISVDENTQGTLEKNVQDSVLAAPESSVVELTPQMQVNSFGTAVETDESLVSDKTAEESTQKLSMLAQTISQEKSGDKGLVASSTSLEDLVRSILTPYLKEWLDGHLPQLVERVVQKEVRRLTDKVDLS